MPPIFKCLICRKDIERSTRTFWIKKGHLLCSTCLDNLDVDKKKPWKFQGSKKEERLNLVLLMLLTKWIVTAHISHKAFDE